MPIYSEKQPMDQRQVKTRRAIRLALLSFLATKPLDKITISELSQAADINRKTFYNHYQNVEQVYCEVNRRYADEVFSSISPIVPNQPQEPERYLSQLICKLNEQPFHTNLLLSAENQHIFFTHLSQQLNPWFRSSGVTGCPVEGLNHYICGGLTALLSDWFCAKTSPCPAEALSTYGAKLMRRTTMPSD